MIDRIVSVTSICSTSEFNHYSGLLNHLKELVSQTRLYKHQYTCVSLAMSNCLTVICNPILKRYEQYTSKVIHSKILSIIENLDMMIMKLTTCIQQLECLVMNYRMTVLQTQ